MKVLNGYDVFEGRSLELRHGDFFDDKLQLDVLVISAWGGFYEPQDGTMIKALEDQCRITVKTLQRALDFSEIPSIKAWISNDLTSMEPPVSWQENRSRFKRLVVIESPRIDSTTAQQLPLEEGIPVFQQMFRMLALLKLHGIDCHTVATPLLNSGRQGVELQPLIAGLRRSMRAGFENVPELRNLVIFDLKANAIQELAWSLAYDGANVVRVNVDGYCGLEGAIVNSSQDFYITLPDEANNLIPLLGSILDKAECKAVSLLEATKALVDHFGLSLKTDPESVLFFPDEIYNADLTPKLHFAGHCKIFKESFGVYPIPSEVIMLLDCGIAQSLLVTTFGLHLIGKQSSPSRCALTS